MINSSLVTTENGDTEPNTYGKSKEWLFRGLAAVALKPYQEIEIRESGDPLVPIPIAEFAVVEPHPYVVLGAPYGDRSPYYLRADVVRRLQQAQAHLQQLQPGWQLQIFDAYRPIPVQAFMVDYSFQTEAAQRGWSLDRLTETQTQTLHAHVSHFWAAPSLDLATPPPHSTGAAIDLTMVDAQQHPLDMGSPIDELSPRSYPDHFATTQDAQAQKFHQARQLLQAVMVTAGFRQHPAEWWHFSYGDQLWAWLETTQPVVHASPQSQPEAVTNASAQATLACYGRADCLAA
ncbi:MAG: M15 family metallopeptidase [Cyanobacteria bacterium P01_H01_bin.121]